MSTPSSITVRLLGWWLPSVVPPRHEMRDMIFVSGAEFDHKCTMNNCTITPATHLPHHGNCRHEHTTMHSQPIVMNNHHTRKFSPKIINVMYHFKIIQVTKTMVVRVIGEMQEHLTHYTANTHNTQAEHSAGCTRFSITPAFTQPCTGAS